ncbi:MAG: phage tail protein I [Synergistaceae bacterium]|nr:phage tail protein I [Synergistaceae bacterium]
MAKLIENLSLMDIAPPSITNDKNVQHIITALDPELLSVSQATREAFIISRINELPESVLDLLAWQWHVDFYELAHSLEAKRAMVLKSISWHRKKGTSGAILQALDILGVEGKFTAWYDLQEEGAQPYTFVIDAKLTSDFWERVDWTKPTQTIRRAIQESKAARSWMSRLFVHMDAESELDIKIGTLTAQGTHHDIAIVQGTQSASDLNIAAGTAIFHNLRHEIAFNQQTKSESDLGVRFGAGVIQGNYHDISAKQETSTSAKLEIAAGTAIFHNLQHDIAINQSRGSQANCNLVTGTTAAHGIFHQIGMKRAENNFSGSISTGCTISQGIYMQIQMAA